MEQSKTLNKFDLEISNNNFNNQIENFEEYRKALNNLKIDLEKKEYELSTINRLYQDLKKLNEKLRQECENLNEKNITLINDKTNLETKYEKEIETLESKYKKQINEYENKIAEFSSFNIDSLRNKIENDIKKENDDKIFEKDKEIDDKNQHIKRLENDIIVIQEEANLEKKSIIRRYEYTKKFT